MNTYDPKKKEIVQSTVANQLALFVTLYSPLQMAADLPENYEKRLDVFQFIRDVPVDWSETKVISAVIGDQLTIARRAKGTTSWYIGSITDETPRSFKVKLDFLEAGKLYEATIYADGDGANYITSPYPVKITKRNYRKGETITMALAAGGGCAVELKMK
jgi:alpha-glucosidase